MKRIKAGWLMLGSAGCLLALQACGASTRSDSAGSSGASGPDASTDAGSGAEAGVVESGGNTGVSGSSSATSGRSGLGGAPVGGGTSLGGAAGAAATGGASACVPGAPCNCKKLVGTTTCAGDKAQCTCPAANECKNEAGTPCFEPCGGDPFGIWRLEESCFPPTSVVTKPGCEPFLSATPTHNEFTMRIADGGQLDTYGEEQWTVASVVPLACLGIESVNRCKDATFYSEIGTFTGSFSGEAACSANACGVCDCKGEESSSLAITSSWSRSGNQLTLGGISEDYCVQGDVLWVGGKNSYGSPKVSYKFSKHSCAGTPVPCAQRTQEQCEVGGTCTFGHCKGKSAAQKGCEVSTWQPECEVIEGCVWEAVGCYGDSNPECSFEACDTEPGCSWGEPKQRCTGEMVPCCQPDASEYGDCSLLDSAACLQAEGCAHLSGACTGDVFCSNQTDPAICSGMGCQFSSGCKQTKCSALSVADCHSVAGCSVQW